jgi:hypothetical protein
MGVLLHFVAACFELCGLHSRDLTSARKFFYPTLVNISGTIGYDPFSPDICHRPNRDRARFAISFGTRGQKNAF